MSQALSPSVARCYGLARVARVWKISRASVYSFKQTPPNPSARRPGPVGACSDAELADHIRQHIAASRLHGEGYRKLWARLRFAGSWQGTADSGRQGGGRTQCDETRAPKPGEPRQRRKRSGPRGLRQTPPGSIGAGGRT